uniref:Trafficking protein particle complex subunit 11-like n=1 Tax=Diabrotica virgifera virgifera TaxID=50390 RepID=A0A6P7H0Z7_DIAVI
MQSNIIQNSIELPPEVTVKPLALVGVSGLDIVNNAVHKSIWETFSSNRRIERAPVLFKLIDNAHEFPVIKPRRTSYDWYIPKGILKKNWMNKHLYEVPAVIVIFYDLDWNDPQWSERMIECASRVQSMRAALEGRNTRLTIVLIQNSPPLPPGEDALAAERAAALCSSCDLSSQSLFVLPHGDHLQGYAVRLENAFYEFAQMYYHNEAKNVKSHKEHLSKTNHQFLFVRHQFKMGFLYELKDDLHTAHKHYIHAYNSLLEIRIVDTNAMEIRTVAGFINYKLCRLLFALNLPRDAISQFKSHIDRFKARMGFHELTFEHYAWLSKQYSVFGDIFDEAVKMGLPAVLTQHPGIYYYQAAQYCLQRKKLCQELCAKVTAYSQPDPLEGANLIEFYGQRPWRPGKLNADPPDPQVEGNGIVALQFLEKQINHSKQIPFGDPKLTQNILQGAIILWQSFVTEKSLKISLDVTNITTCLTVKGRFMKKTYEVDQKIIVELFIRSTCPFPITLSNIAISISAENQTNEYSVQTDNDESLSFQQDEIKRFIVEFPADPADINKDIQISSINLYLCSTPECSIDLKFAATTTSNDNHLELYHFKYNKNKINFDTIQLLPQATIVPRESKLQVEFEHESPALLGEWYIIRINVKNEEEDEVQDLKIDVWIEEEIANVELSTEPSDKQKKLNLVLNNPTTLNVHEEINTNFYVRSNIMCKCNIQVKLTYVLSGEKNIQSIKSETVHLSVIEPFEVSTKYMSLLMAEIDKFYVTEKFGIMNYITFMSSCPIEIEDTNFEYNHLVSPEEATYTSQIKGSVFNNAEIGGELHLATCNKVSEQSINVGQYHVKWKRVGGESTTTTLAVTGLPCKWIPVGLKMVTPAHGFVRTSMMLEYHLENRSQQLLQLELSMDASEAFMFSGYKQFSVTLLPISTRVLQYNLCPMIAGSVALPKLSLKISSEATENEATIIQQEELNFLISRSLPTHVYVMPQLKGSAEISNMLSTENVAVVG